MVRLALTTLLLCELFSAHPAKAAQCRAIAGGSPALASIDAEARLRWLDQRLESDARRAHIWTVAWGSTYASLAVLQLALLPTADNTGDRAENVVAASTAFIGVMAGLLLPLRVLRDQRFWSDYRRRAPPTTDPCLLLHTGEALLLRDAASEAFGVSPLVHIGNFAINIAAGLVLGLGYGRWHAFAYSSLVGIVVGEVQIATQPTDAVEDLRRYRAGDLASAHPLRLGVALAPLVSNSGGGAMVSFRW